LKNSKKRNLKTQRKSTLDQLIQSTNNPSVCTLKKQEQEAIAKKVSKFVSKQVEQAVATYTQFSEVLPVKARAVGYIWEMISGIYYKTPAEFVTANSKFSEKIHKEYNKDETSQWRLNVLHGRKLANKTLLSVIMSVVNGEQNGNDEFIV